MNTLRIWISLLVIISFLSNETNAFKSFLPKPISRLPCQSSPPLQSSLSTTVNTATKGSLSLSVQNLLSAAIVATKFVLNPSIGGGVLSGALHAITGNN